VTAGFSIRPARPRDVGGIQRVSAATGQPAVDSGADGAYVEFVLETGTAVVAVGEDEGIVGWGAVRGHVLGSMLSDLFVSPDHQGSGLGRALLAGLWPPGPGQRRFTFSSRHPSAVPVYARAALLPSWPLLYLRGPRPERAPMSARRVEAATAAEAEARLVGADRRADYAFWARVAGSAGVVVSDGTRVVAVGAVRSGALLHLCCPSVPEAQAALQAALTAAADPIVAVQVPGRHPAVPDLLESGFRIIDYDIAMASAGLDLPTTWAYSPGLG
jgi:GNAT superfamily N-acetyltransferase